MPDCSLPRTERLRSLGAVRRMFESGESGFIFPFRYVWFAEADEIPSVEAYRLQKQTLKNGSPANLDLALIYSSKEMLPYKTIQNAVRRILETVVEHL